MGLCCATANQDKADNEAIEVHVMGSPRPVSEMSIENMVMIIKVQSVFRGVLARRRMQEKGMKCSLIKKIGTTHTQYIHEETLAENQLKVQNIRDGLDEFM